MESGRKKYLKNFIVLIDNTLMSVIMRVQRATRRLCDISSQSSGWE